MPADACGAGCRHARTISICKMTPILDQRAMVSSSLAYVEPHCKLHNPVSCSSKPHGKDAATRSGCSHVLQLGDYRLGVAQLESEVLALLHGAL